MFGLGKTEQRAIQATPWGPWFGDAQYPVWAGTQVDRDSSLQLLTVYGCVRLICDSIATLPLDVYRKTADGSTIEANTPVWIDKPVPGLDRVAWVTQVLSSLLLDGNAFIAVSTDAQQRIVELRPLDAMKVQVRRENGTKAFFINGLPSPLPIVHIPAMMLAGCDVGYSPVEAARQSIGHGLAAQEYGARLFSQGGTAGGVIEVPGELSPGKAEEMAKGWARKHSGLKKAHMPGVLEGGATWKPTSVTPEQAQFLETRHYTAEEIMSQMFLIDPTEFGMGGSGKGQNITYANLWQRNTHLVQRTLLPWIIRLENALSSLLAAPRYVKFNVDGLLRADTKTRYEAYQIGITTGFLGADEVRQFEDLPPRDDLMPMPAMQTTPNMGDSNGN